MAIKGLCGGVRGSRGVGKGRREDMAWTYSKEQKHLSPKILRKWWVIKRWSLLM